MKQKPSDEGDTYHGRALDSLSEMQGRYASLSKPRNIGAGDGYPDQPASYPLRDHPELPDDFTDKVEEPTSDRFGVDLNRIPGAPPPESSDHVSSQAIDEIADTPAATLSSFDRRF